MPFFSLVLHISHRARIQHLIATYSYVSFGARPCSNVSPAPCPIFVSLKRKYICHFTSEENDRNSSPLSGCSSSKLRAFLLDNFLLSTQQVDCSIHFIIKIVYTTKMLTELPSDDTRMQPSSAKRIRLDEASPSDEASDKAIPPTGGKTPLEAAMAAATTYVERSTRSSNPSLPILFDKSSRMRLLTTTKVRSSRKWLPPPSTSPRSAEPWE